MYIYRSTLLVSPGIFIAKMIIFKKKTTTIWLADIDYESNFFFISEHSLRHNIFHKYFADVIQFRSNSNILLKFGLIYYKK